MEAAIINIDLAKQGLKKDSDWHLEPLSDIHVGHPNCNYGALIKTIKKIAESKNHSTMLLGDNTDNIRWDDKRFQPHKNMQEPITQIQYLRKIFEPIWKHNDGGIKCFGALIGNHEYNGAARMTDEDYKREYCYPISEGGMGLRWLGTMCYIKINFLWKGDRIHSYKILAAHGQYKGSQSGGELNQQKRFPAAHELFDVYLTGDSHDKKMDKSILQSIIEVDGEPKIQRRKVIFASCGTFQETFELGYRNYPEQKPYYSRNAEVGTVTITFNPYQKKLYSHE